MLTPTFSRNPPAYEAEAAPRITAATKPTVSFFIQKDRRRRGLLVRKKCSVFATFCLNKEHGGASWATQTKGDYDSDYDMDDDLDLNPCRNRYRNPCAYRRGKGMSMGRSEPSGIVAMNKSGDGSSSSPWQSTNTQLNS